MNKVAVLMAEGFEEGETLTIVDILRRLSIECHTVYFGSPMVKGMHGILVQGDRPFEAGLEEYTALVLPGGRPGGENLRNNPEVVALVKKFCRTKGKYVAAMCSGTTVLAQAGVIRGKRVTGYTGYAEKLPGAVFLEDVCVVDDNLITSRGPATPYPLAFALAEALGKDAAPLRETMMYTLAGGIG